MSKLKIHFTNEKSRVVIARAICGMLCHSDQITNDPAEVTCKRCIGKLAKLPKFKDIIGLYKDKKTRKKPLQSKLKTR